MCTLSFLNFVLFSSHSFFNAIIVFVFVLFKLTSLIQSFAIFFFTDVLSIFVLTNFLLCYPLCFLATVFGWLWLRMSAKISLSIEMHLFTTLLLLVARRNVSLQPITVPIQDCQEGRSCSSWIAPGWPTRINEAWFSAIRSYHEVNEVQHISIKSSPE